MWVSLKGELADGKSQVLSSYEKMFFPNITATLVTPIPGGHSLDLCSLLAEAVSIVLCVTWHYDLNARYLLVDSNSRKISSCG